MVIDRKDAQLNTLNKELAAVFAKIGGPPLVPVPTRETIGRFRKGFAALNKRYNQSKFALSHLPATPTWTESDHDCPVRDGSTIKIRAYHPNEAQGPLPLGIMLHGGGWVMGDLETEAFMCKVLCSRLQMVMINVDFRNHPDVDFPVPVQDCYDVVRWLSSHASELDKRVDLAHGFVIGGSSGGGTYASISCRLARDEKMQPPLTGCFLACPVLGDEVLDDNGQLIGGKRMWGDRCISGVTNANAPLMNSEYQGAIRNLANFDFKSALLSPFLSHSYENLPRTYTQVCGLDPWRDRGIVYHEELEKAGAEVKISVYNGLPHCWWTSFPMLKITNIWLEDTVRGLQWLLRREHNVVKPTAKI